METYAKDNHFKLIMKTAFISLTLTFFSAQTSIYLVGFLVEGDTWFPRSCYRTTQSKKQNKATLYMLFCFNIFNVDSIFENVDYSILFSKEFYAHNSQV